MSFTNHVSVSQHPPHNTPPCFTNNSYLSASWSQYQSRITHHSAPTACLYPASMTIQLVHFRDYYHCKNAYSHLDLESTNAMLQRLRDYSKKRGAAPDLIIEFDTVGLKGNLSTGVTLYAVRSNLIRSDGTYSSLLLVLFLSESSSSSDDQISRGLGSVITYTSTSPGLACQLDIIFAER